MKPYKGRRWIQKKRKRRIRSYLRLRQRGKRKRRWAAFLFAVLVCALFWRTARESGTFSLPVIRRAADREQVEAEDARPSPLIREGIRLQLRDGTLELFRQREEDRQEEQMPMSHSSD